MARHFLRACPSSRPVSSPSSGSNGHISPRRTDRPGCLSLRRLPSRSLRSSLTRSCSKSSVNQRVDRSYVTYVTLGMAWSYSLQPVLAGLRAPPLTFPARVNPLSCPPRAREFFPLSSLHVAWRDVSFYKRSHSIEKAAWMNL